MKADIGGKRLGSGNKMEANLHGYARSTHNLSKVWRSTMASGTLVPFLNLIATPADDFEIDLNAQLNTIPTNGPLFAKYKVQLDVFCSPVRLYNGKLHNNPLGVGLNMDKIKFPQITLKANQLNYTDKNTAIEFQQFNQSSLLAYLGIRGLGNGKPTESFVQKDKNALGILSYVDIYKNYYANKQEEIGAMIGTDVTTGAPTITRWSTYTWDGEETFYTNPPNANVELNSNIWYITLYGTNLGDASAIEYYDMPNDNWESLANLTPRTTSNEKNTEMKCFDFTSYTVIGNQGFRGSSTFESGKITIKTFPLQNIDEMRDEILSETQVLAPFNINASQAGKQLPYSEIWETTSKGNSKSKFSQVGLLLKTYQSDIFNNWISTEWIDGEDGIAKVTAIDTSSGSFTMDALNLAEKVYDMLNRIAISGGTYYDWIEAVYDTSAPKLAETPVFMGGMSAYIEFGEVVSTADTNTSNAGDQPLGTLAGKGYLDKESVKGGRIRIRVSEPSIIQGIISITPIIDYSQGNAWYTRLETVDDLHKPGLDGIGFQELITEQMAFWENEVDAQGKETLFSAGKQPAWINYMTNYNECFGNFADPKKEMFMTLNRRYEVDPTTKRIKDLTTYIDPQKYNYAFANAKLEAQNFWMQVGMGIKARRKMSAKIIPNL